MSMINSIILEGVVVEDATLMELSKDCIICRFQIEVTRKLMHDEKEVSKFDIKGFGEVGKRLQSKARKGKGIRIVGRLANGENDKAYVVAEHFYIIPETYF